MRIALCSDEPYPVHQTVRTLLQNAGHEVVPFGAVRSGVDTSWVLAAHEAARSVAAGECDEGVFFCWSGTGICIAANKTAGIRAALCHDPLAAQAARIWNHANVLCLSNRRLSDDMAREILSAWFANFDRAPGAQGVAELRALEDAAKR